MVRHDPLLRSIRPGSASHEPGHACPRTVAVRILPAGLKRIVQLRHLAGDQVGAGVLDIEIRFGIDRVRLVPGDVIRAALQPFLQGPRRDALAGGRRTLGEPGADVCR